METVPVKDVGSTVSEFLLFDQCHFGYFFYLWPDINQEQPWTKLGYLSSYLFIFFLPRAVQPLRLDGRKMLWAVIVSKSAALIKNMTLFSYL